VISLGAKHLTCAENLMAEPGMLRRVKIFLHHFAVANVAILSARSPTMEQFGWDMQSLVKRLLRRSMAMKKLFCLVSPVSHWNWTPKSTRYEIHSYA
jgi:hypothetical protein